MLMDVNDDIKKLVIRFPSAMHEVNSYLLKGINGYTVIDTGLYSEEAIATWETLLETGIVVEKVVLTHTHQDHIGLAKWFQEHIQVPIYTSKRGYEEMVKHRDEAKIRKSLTDLVSIHGGPVLPKRIRNDSFIYDFEPDGFFDEKDPILLGDRMYEAIWTPGHAPDHYCFYQKDTKLMLIGDHILKDISPVIGLWTGEELNPLKDYYASLELMLHYPTELALPGHGENLENLDKRVHTLMQRNDYRLEEVMRIITANAMTANEVCEEIYGKLKFPVSISPFMAALTRLLFLESIGKIDRFNKDGNIYFRACS